MLEINEANFSENTSQGLVLVDFYATWCPPCRALAPVLESLKGIKVLKVNTDENQSLAKEKQVSALPTVVIMKDGVEVDRLVGLQDRKILQDRIDALK